MPIKIILLNGPPHSGKDQTGEYMWRPHVKLCKLAGALKAATHALFGASDLSPDAFEGPIKDEPNKIFFGMSPRQAYITVSEQMTKPRFGDEFFARVLISTIRRAEADGHSGAVVTDSGFAREAKTLIKEFGADNVLLVRIHRPGYTFAGDSRSYIELDEVRSLDLQNDKSLEYLRVVAQAIRGDFIG